MAKAVSATMGTGSRSTGPEVAASIWRMSAVAVHPSMTGIEQSMSTW
jgi:hypothetical protein